jgi:DNA-binding transcriptional regulator YiaG
MQTKIERHYLYEGLGFPIDLKDITMINIGNEWLPQIDVHQVADNAIKNLAVQQERLTGNQVKFIRSYFSMSLREFGKEVVHETHSAVKKWEAKGESETNMNLNTEQVLRTFLIEETQIKTKKQQADFYGIFQKSKVFLPTKDTKKKTKKTAIAKEIKRKSSASKHKTQSSSASKGRKKQNNIKQYA